MYNQEALHDKLEEIMWEGADFTDTQATTSKDDEQIRDIEDDLQRELVFYNQVKAWHVHFLYVSKVSLWPWTDWKKQPVLCMTTYKPVTQAQLGFLPNMRMKKSTLSKLADHVLGCPSLSLLPI